MSTETVPRAVNAGTMTQGDDGSMSAPKRTCCIEGCERPYDSRGWCTMHRKRWRRHGDPLWEPPTFEDRFWAMVALAGPDECWLWLGRPSNSDGYGRFCARGAHRVAYELCTGPIPSGLWVLHHCDNPPCVNPAHLFLGTPTDNMADRHAKGRDARGETNGNAKLTEAAVRAIRETRGSSQRDLAQRYGVSPPLISAIQTGKAWRHVSCA